MWLNYVLIVAKSIGANEITSGVIAVIIAGAGFFGSLLFIMYMFGKEIYKAE